MAYGGRKSGSNGYAIWASIDGTCAILGVSLSSRHPATTAPIRSTALIRIEIEAEGEAVKVDRGERMRQIFVGRSRRRPPSAAPPFCSHRQSAQPSASRSRRALRSAPTGGRRRRAARATPPLLRPSLASLDLSGVTERSCEREDNDEKRKKEK
uniref:Uncharacterized protein n=1 Tax=Oryza sativa subsp. japonica TaxID=39947 RepID=Q7X6Q7_ORYSJ|nr:hypothetical protein [Oryza sativa Japonica Group]BAC79760.1 hypothetical protein [Oryza sativa Japonica Group]